MIVCSCNVFSDLEIRAAFSMADRPNGTSLLAFLPCLDRVIGDA